MLIRFVVRDSLVCSSKVAAKSPAMAQAIGPCRWGNQPNNVATPTGLEGNCIVVSIPTHTTGIVLDPRCWSLPRVCQDACMQHCQSLTLLPFSFILSHQGFDSNVYILKFDLFSVCRFAYEKYNITTLVSVSVSIPWPASLLLNLQNSVPFEN